MSAGPCPRCGQPLAPSPGPLGETACADCAGRILDAALTRRVLLDEAGLDPAVIQELARESVGPRLTCPTCRQPMAPVTLKATPVDICFPCGVTFLDAGELERLSGGRHREELLPPTRIRPVDQLPADIDEPKPDPRATWEKALPLYVLEAWLLWGWFVVGGIVGSPLVAVGAALGVIAIPLGFSMMANVDVRDVFARYRRPGFHWGFGYHRHGVGGALLFLAAIFVGGLVSTVNAIIAERFPRVFSTRNALVALALLGVAGVVMTVL